MSNPVAPDPEARLDQELLDVDGVPPTPRTPAPTATPNPAAPDAEARLDEELRNVEGGPPVRPIALTITPWVTYVLIAANLIAFGLAVAAGADAINPTPQKLIDVGGNFAPLTLNGEPWRLFTSMFLHVGMLHIGMNMVCLAQGRVVEQLLGRVPFIAIYLVSGLLGALLSVARNGNVVSVGASGAVFGIYGAFGAYLVFRKAAIDEAIWQKTSRQIGTFVGINLVYGFATPNIDMSAHIGGIVAGFAMAAAMLVGTRADAQRMKRALGLGLAGVALAASVVVVLRPPTDVTSVHETFAKVEASCIASWNKILEGGNAGTLGKDEGIAQLERDVIAPWKAMREQVFAVEDPPARLDRLWAAIKSYLGSRQEAWESYLPLLRASGTGEPIKVEVRDALLDDYQRKEQAARRDVEALKAEYARLSKS